MPKPTHSPLPWFGDESRDEQDNFPIYAIDPKTLSSYPVGSTYTPDDFFHILRCVNAERPTQGILEAARVVVGMTGYTVDNLDKLREELEKYDTAL